MTRIRRCLRSLAVAIGALALTTSTLTPAVARGMRRAADTRTDPAQTLVTALERAAEAHGRNLVSFETLRLLYRYAHQSYGRGGADHFDRAAAAAWTRARIDPRRVQRIFDEKILPFEERLRGTFVPEVARLPFDASRQQVMYAMSGSGDDLCLGEAAGNVCREVAGEIVDPKQPSPTLHSAYGHLVRNTPVHFDGVDADIACVTDADCAPFAEGALHGRCGTGDSSYDWTVGDLEGVDDTPDVCIFGPQWHGAQNLRLQGNNLFDTNAQVTLLRVEEPDGTLTGADTVGILSNGQLVVSAIGGGDLSGAGLLSVVEETATWGGVAAEYLTFTGQAEFYHPNAYQAANWHDLLDVPLPEDLLPGVYETRVVYRPGAFLDTLTDAPSEAYYTPLLPDTEYALTNPIRIRVSGQGEIEVPHRFEVVRTKVCEPQETYDDPRIDSLVYKIDFEANGIKLDGSMTDDEVVGALDAIELGATPPGVLKLIDAQHSWDGTDEGDVLPIGESANLHLAPGQGIVAFTEIWEDDGDGVPPALSERVDEAIALTFSIASLAVAEYGLAAVAEFCTDGWTCAVVIAVVVVVIIVMELWEYFSAPEYLGLSTAVYTYDQIRLMTHASQLGLSVDDVQALHDNWPASQVLLPSLTPSSGSFELPENWPESGTVEFTDHPRMDGQAACGLVENGGFVPGEYNEFRALRAVNTSPAPDDTSLYVTHYRITRFDL